MNIAESRKGNLPKKRCEQLPLHGAHFGADVEADNSVLAIEQPYMHAYSVIRISSVILIKQKIMITPELKNSAIISRIAATAFSNHIL